MKQQNNSWAWLDRISPQINIFWHGSTSAGWIEPARRIYDHELVIITGGECFIKVGSVSIKCPKWSFVIIPPDTIHTTINRSATPLYRYCLHFDWLPINKPHSSAPGVFHPQKIPKSMVRNPPSFIPDKIFQGRIVSAVWIEELLERLANRWQSKEPALRWSCRALLLELLLLILAPSIGPRPGLDRTQQLAQKVRDILRRPVSQKYSIRELLETLGYSYAHLCRTFHAIYKLSPLEYLNAVRIETAKIRLMENRYSVKEVAGMAGFNSPQYFGRSFKKRTGITPGKFMNTHSSTEKIMDMEGRVWKHG